MPITIRMAIVGSFVARQPFVLCVLLVPEWMHYGVRSEVALGELVAIYSVAAALASLPSGRLVSRVAPRTVLSAVCAATSMGLLIGAMANLDFLSLAAMMVVSGCCSSIAQTLSNTTMVRARLRGGRGVLFAINQSALPMSLGVMGLLLPAVSAVIRIPVIFAMLALALLVIGMFDWLRATQRGRAGTTTSSTDRGDGECGIAHGGVRRTPVATVQVSLLVLGVVSLLGTASANILTSFIDPSLVLAGWQPAWASRVAGLGGLLATVSRIGFGRFVDRRSISFGTLFGYLFITASVGYVLIALGSKGVAGTILLLVGVFVCFSCGWGWSGVFNYAVSSRYREDVEYATAVITFGAKVGGIIGPLLLGFVFSHTFNWVGWVLTCSLVLTAGVISRRFDWLPRRAV